MVSAMGDFSIYMARSLRAAITPPFRFKDFMIQLEFVAWQSLPVILFCVSFAAVDQAHEGFHTKMEMISRRAYGGQEF